MFREHDIVTLTAAIPDNGVLHIPSVKSGNSGRALIPGDIGTIVHIYPGREAFPVEFDFIRGEKLSPWNSTGRTFTPRP